jgi:hypothetical protein
MDDESRPDDRGYEGAGPDALGSGSHGCACCTGRDQAFEYHARTVRLETNGELIDPEGDTGVLDAPLSPDVRRALARFLDGSTVRTLRDWVGAVRDRTGGAAIDMEDLCHEQAETPHWGELDGDRYHFTCFFDAVVLAALAEAPVDVRTESPDGTVIEATVAGDGDLTVDPPGTLMSFGALTVPSVIPDGEPTREDVYAAICPVVKAFPSPGAYERWSTSVPAATIAIPLADATAVAAAIAD